jgi:hypothetical protein
MPSEKKPHELIEILLPNGQPGLRLMSSRKSNSCPPKTADVIITKTARARAVLDTIKVGNQALESEH